jgi:predicted nucleic acid-binding protein
VGSVIYLDTSFLVSLYCPDANSGPAAILAQSADQPMIVTDLCDVEAFNAIALRVFRREISQRQADTSVNHLDTDLRNQVFHLATLPQAAFQRTRTLSRQITPKIGTRTADLLHIAAALELGATSFYTFDVRQRRAAQAAALKSNPIP